jgi:prepilin-type processing-associated H-X9-DG protein
MQSLLHNITTYLLTQSTHILLLFIALALICLALKNKTAHLRYLLWLLLIAKCLLPSTVTVPLAVLPEKQIASPAPPAPAVEYTFPPVEVPYTPAPLLPAPVPPPEPKLLDRLAQIPPKTYFASFWLIGLSLFLIITLIRAISLNLRFRRKRIPLTARLAEETACILHKFGDLKPPVYLLPDIGQPFVWGLFRGSIYLPADFTKTTTPYRRRAILAHELAHVKRFDALVNLLQIIAQALFWFHPFVWLANRLIRAEREKACDETAIAKLSTSPKDYSSAIVDTIIAEYKSTMPVPSLAVAGPIKNIEDRIKTVMTPGKKFYTRPTFIALAAILLLAAVIVPTTIAITTRKPKPKDTLDPIKSQTTSDFKATLPNGVTVELVGVCEHPSEGKQWWAPDGTFLEKAPYKTMGSRLKHHDGSSEYEFVFRAESLNRASFRVQVPGCSHSTYTGTPYGWDGNRVEDLRVYTANQPDDKTEALVRIGATADKWLSQAIHKPDEHEKTYDSGGQSIAFGSPYETDGNTILPVVHNLNNPEAEVAVRIVAIKKDGKVRSSSISGSGGNVLHGWTCRFKSLSLDQIKEFQFQTRPYHWITFKNVSLKPGKNTKPVIEIEKDIPKTEPETKKPNFTETLPNQKTNQNTKTEDESAAAADIEKAEFGPVDFETYFPQDASGAEALEQLWNDPDKDLREADEILETVRKGLRSYKGPGNILRWIGNLFIWGEDPQNQKAIELMYHASGSPDRGLYGEAIYFGLSVTKDKTPEILRAMAAVAMKTDDYYNVTGRILWGCRNQKSELIACLDLYLKSDDKSTRQKAQDVKEYLTDSKAFMAKRAEEHKESVKTEYADKLPQFKNDLLNGNSQTRLDTLKLLQGEGIMTIVDESFLDAFQACTKDSNANVRSTAARMMGDKFVWGADPQNTRAIEILLPLLDDPDRSTRGTAVYFGLSTVRSPDKELIEKLLLTILDDREINYYGRVIGCLRRNKNASAETLTEWMDQSDTNQQRALKAYEIYEDILAQPLPDEYADRFAGRKSDAHEGLVAMCFRDDPISAEELKSYFLKCLTDSNLTQKVLDFYIIQNRETAVAMFTCANLADRNALREALIFGSGFKVAGYFHGRIGPTGSGWLQSLSRFREHNKPNRINLTNTKTETTAALDPLQQRTLSMQNLKQLALACHLFAEDFAGNLPEDISQLKPYLKNDTFSWIKDNVQYLPKGSLKDIQGPAFVAIAYDKTFLQQYNGTTVAFVDGHVEYISNPNKLTELGIPKKQLTLSMQNLKQFALACHLFAEDYADNLPEDIPQLKTYLKNDNFNWITDNVMYLPRGKLKVIQHPAFVAIAYDKTMLRQYDGTTVAFADGHVEYITGPDKLKDLGIPAKDISVEARLMLVDELFLKDVAADLGLADDPNKNVKTDSRATVSAGAPDNQKTSNVDINAKFLDSLQAKFLIRASQKYKNSKVLTTPKVTVLDGETAEFTSLITETYVDTGSAQTESFENGIRLKVQPNILPGGKQNLRLEVGFTLTDVTGYQERTSENNQPYKIPFLEETEIVTSAVVPDRGTLLIIGPNVAPSIQKDKVFAPEKNPQKLLLLIKPTIINQLEH